MRLKLFLGPSFVLSVLLFLHIHHNVEAICLTRFYAQAVTVQRAAEFDIYFSRAEVETAADCAVFCGKRQFCRSAVYNHDTKSCALSYDKVIECNTQKQRYNTFHLTTDGAESMSIITCVELCEKDKPKFQDSKPATLFSRNGPSENVEDDGMNSAARFLSKIKFGSKRESGQPEHGRGDSGRFVAISKGRTKLNPNGTAQLPPEIIDSETPSTAIIEALQRLMDEIDETYKNKPHQSKASVQSGQLIGRIQTETQLSTGGGHKFGSEDSPQNDTINLLGLKTHQKIPRKGTDDTLKNKEVDLTDHRLNKKQEMTIRDLITGGPANRFHAEKVKFHAKPLDVQEVFNGTSNLTSLGETYHFGESRKDDTGGFFKWLQPDERFTLPPEVNLPPEVAKLVPQILSAVGQSQIGKPKGTGLSFEITEKNSMPKVKNTTETGDDPRETLRRTLTRFAKIKVEETTSTESDKGRRPGEQEEEKENKVKEIFNSAASNLDQIIVNGHLLSPDEILNLRRLELSTSTTTTTQKPWKPASQLFGASDEEDEEDLLTTKVPADHPHRDTDPNGYLNTFLIQGISSMIHQNDAREAKNDDHKRQLVRSDVTTSPLPLESSTWTTTSLPVLTTTTSSGPIVCYRQIPQQTLLYASFETLHGISLNECRCRCAETWLNLTADVSSNGHLKCKSVLYNEIAQECSLNQGDHNGKYDLIYDKLSDYHYVSCEIKYLLSAARRICAKILPSIVENLPTPLKIRRPNEIGENTSGSLLRDPPRTPTKTAEKKRLEALPVLSTPPISTSSPIPLSTIETQTRSLPDSTSTRPPPASTRPSPASTRPSPASTRPTQSIPKLQKLSEIEEKQSNRLSTKTERIPTVTLSSTIDRQRIETTTSEDSDLLIQEADKRPKKGDDESTGPALTTRIHEEADRSTSNFRESNTQSTTPFSISTTTTSYDPLTIAGYTDGCFEVIEGYMMQNTVGGLERDVESISDCQCLCANSLSSKKYEFQCISATYYRKERECVLNLNDRKIHPENFMRHTDVAGGGNVAVTYLGLVCSQKKAVKLHTQNGQCRASKTSSTSTTTTTTVKPVSINSDDCFLELPNYVLEGTALAVETNVTVDQCKCYCVDSERRYGTDCQSLEYYYDSQTCLLNKENRISEPDHFNYDVHGLRHSYFDYRCHAEKLTLTVYVEQICRKVIDLRIADIQPTTDSSLDTDYSAQEEHNNEVRLVTQTQRLPNQEDIRVATERVKILKFINESEDDEGESEEEDSMPKEPQKLKRKKFKQGATVVTTSSTSPLTTTKNTGRLPEVDELEGEEELERFEATSTTETPKTSTTTQRFATTQRSATTTARGTTSKTTTTTKEATTVTQTPYPPVGQCQYSALYQTAFNGDRLHKRFKVRNATECFAGCHWEKCRSANLIQTGDPIKFCELYKDSIVDFRRTNVLYFDRDTVHFDSISCEVNPEN